MAQAPAMTPPDLRDPRIRSAALRAMTRQLVVGSSFCADRARAVAASMLDAGVAAAELEARLPASAPDRAP